MSYLNANEFKPEEVHVHVKSNGTKERILVTYGPAMRSLSFVTPPSKTNYPRVTGDGDYREGSQYGPQTPDKANYVVDVNGSCEENEAIDEFFTKVVKPIDEKVLDFIHANQLRFLNRKNLKKDELGMLQIKSVKHGFNRDTGNPLPPRMDLKCRKFYTDQVGNKREREVSVCDCNGQVVEKGEVNPGDIVACTMHLGEVYYGVGGDKFGISWQLEDVAVLCQEQHKKNKVNVPALESVAYAHKHDYETPVSAY